MAHSENNYFNCDLASGRSGDFRNACSQYANGTGKTREETVDALEIRGNDGLAKGNRENGEIQSQLNPRGRACGNIFLTRIFNFHDRFVGVLAAGNYSRTLHRFVALRYRLQPRFSTAALRGVASCYQPDKSPVYDINRLK